MWKCCIFSPLELSTFAFNQFEEKGFNAKLAAESFPHNGTSAYIFPHTQTHALSGNSSLQRHFIAQFILISYPIRDNISSPPSRWRSPMEWLRGVKRRMFLPTDSSHKAHPRLPPPPETPPPPSSLPLTRTALKCLWVFMFVVFYRSGQEPGAVKVWTGGGRRRHGRERWRRMSGELL